jgi:acetyl-CoA carboxylase biotin carboxyl carrier protein
MTQKDNDLIKIKKIIKIMQENDLVELEIAHGDDKVMLKRASAQQHLMTAFPMTGHGFAAPAPAPTQAKQEDDNLIDIKSPMVGTFYRAASPDSQPFVESGAHVDPQSVVCIIEAMKVMNEIKADVTGTITKILVSNGQAVEFGQVLYKVKPL